MIDQSEIKLLLHGIDTLQCAYYLMPTTITHNDFLRLKKEKERIAKSKKREAAPVSVGNSEFLLQPYGSRSGYSVILTNEDFRIEMGDRIRPNFYVTFRSQGLWRLSAFLLHDKFLKWAASAGYTPYEAESLSRVDYCFDYHLSCIDFDENNFVSRCKKDCQYRENGKVQTFSMGTGDVRLRVYDKVAEIQQQSAKVWFQKLWEQETDVWRIEWQTRKPVLKAFQICTFKDLSEKQGDLLHYLALEHDTLRCPNEDSNSSRWPLHPLWKDLVKQIETLPQLGIKRIQGRQSALEERRMRIGVAVLGYLKRCAATECVLDGKSDMSFAEALRRMEGLLLSVYEPFTWGIDVQKRVKEIERGQW